MKNDRLAKSEALPPKRTDLQEEFTVLPEADREEAVPVVTKALWVRRP